MTARSPRRAASPAALALLAALGGGCTLTTEWRGDERFVVAEVDWTPGETTLVQVLADLGPPDRIHRVGRDLWLSYQFRYHQSSTLLLSAYGMKVFRSRAGEDVDATLFVVLDERDRLLHYGRSELPDTSILSTAY